MRCKICKQHFKKIYCREMCKKCYDKIHYPKYYKSNLKEILKRQKIYDKDHQEDRYEYRKRRRVENIESGRIYDKKWKKDKRNSDINFKLRQHITTRIYKALKRNKKSGITIRLLGCTIRQFRKYIESKWLPGMSWENYNKNGWHIDHIKQVIKFDLSKPEEQQKCFYYTNLRPLWCTTEIALKNSCNEIGNLNRSKK